MGELLRLRPRGRGRVLYQLPDDLVTFGDSIRVLSEAGMLPPLPENAGDPVGQPWLCRPCPRCGRLTAVGRGERNQPVSVCTGCRAEWLAGHGVSQADMAAADAEIGDSLTKFLARLRKAKRRAGHDET